VSQIAREVIFASYFDNWRSQLYHFTEI